MKNLIYYLLLFYALVCVLSITFFSGTGDSGDSVTHYLFAKYAPSHPILFLNHWAKPVFVLLASPFAQFGFIGVKIFNSLISLLVIFFTYKTAEKLEIKNAILVAVFLIFSPLFYILTFSGLTEPLFALFTILGIYFCSKQKHITAALIISFLPYVRSEGLIIIGIFGLYFLYKSLWKPLPFLTLGSVIYGFIGLFVFGDFFWVFTEIPYAKLSSVYGQGAFFHFVEQLINVTGVPIYILFWIGFLFLFALIIKKKTHAEQHILLFLGFCAFFTAHTLFWYLGIFNSMGLKRVLIGIIPLIALISLIGFNFISERVHSKPKLKKGVQIFLIGYILLFPFLPNPSAINWEKDMMLNPDQKIAIQVSEFILNEKLINYPLLYNHRYLSIPLNIDYFDSKKCLQITSENIKTMKAGNLLIWDNHYGEFESGFRQGKLDSNSTLTNIGIFKTNELGKNAIFSVYKKN
ncbi:hypothetical protein [Aurantibacillus circumpalustris]|uniref:hypothetical protein n=1 Tax=Aurantibacillus circumpalustris TaxID=3036359 RepID=UPI00295C13A3|nr:hypothetical protein [Aurantibacillus circumpalustris]